MSKFTPWTQEQVEQWCKPDRHPRFGDIYDLSARELYRAAYRDGFHEALEKAAEMIEASPTVTVWDTHQAKLVGVDLIGDKK